MRASVSTNKFTAGAWRLQTLRVFMVLLAVLLIGRLFILQVTQHSLYSALASNRYGNASAFKPERGSILVQDKDSYYPVAANKKVENLIISPKDITDDQSVARTISGITGVQESLIKEALKQKEKRYWLVKKELNEAELKAVADAKSQGLLPKQGVWLEAETRRYYPEGDFLSQVLGFIGYAGDVRKGVYGLESKFEELLAGSGGGIEEGEGEGVLAAGSKFIPAHNGSSLVLTIDRAIQTQAELVIKEYVQKFGADGGSVIVADPKTGAILAMASAPSFDLNKFNEVENSSVYTNPVVQGRYEPGSIMKPLTMAAGLDSGKVDPEESYQDAGSAVFGGYTIRNSDFEAHGLQTMTQVLEKSLNTGMVYIQRKMGGETMRHYFKKFGFNEKTEITLPGEIAGDLRNLEADSEINFATASFGQGVSVTPAEMIQAYTAIAGNGEMKRLHIVSEIQHPDGRREIVQPQTVRKVVSAETAATVSRMMVNVVENGHGKRAKVNGYYIAGKTGTAQVPLVDGRGYDPNKTIGSFVGFGPVENPAFVMLVKIENPKGVLFAESTAAPAFGEIANFILDYLQVPPTRE